MAGKGSAPRPRKISREDLYRSWERTFKKACKCYNCGNGPEGSELYCLLADRIDPEDLFTPMLCDRAEDLP